MMMWWGWQRWKWQWWRNNWCYRRCPEWRLYLWPWSTWLARSLMLIMQIPSMALQTSTYCGPFLSRREPTPYWNFSLVVYFRSGMLYRATKQTSIQCKRESQTWLNQSDGSVSLLSAKSFEMLSSSLGQENVLLPKSPVLYDWTVPLHLIKTMIVLVTKVIISV